MPARSIAGSIRPRSTAWPGKPIDWFANLIRVVPLRYWGAMRRVTWASLQISAFMGMTSSATATRSGTYYRHYLDGDRGRGDDIKSFYAEYLAMMDLPAEFICRPCRSVFRTMTWRSADSAIAVVRVRPEAIRRTALFTVEGERDDICSIGQTLAAQ